MRAHAEGGTLGFSRVAESAPRDTLVQVDTARRRRLEATMLHTLVRRQTVAVVATMAVAMSMHPGYTVHI
eukprot:5219969-Pleurochrysis_carterae.AAC.5